MSAPTPPAGDRAPVPAPAPAPGPAPSAPRASGSAKDAALLRILKQALPYIRQHKKQIMVVKLGGELAANERALRSLAEDISLLVHVGIRLVVVHGGGPQATEMSRRLGITPLMVEGRRVTDEQTLDVAKMVFAGKINTDILSALRGQGVRAVGLSGVDADIVSATRRKPTEMRDEATGGTRLVDFGHVGDVHQVDSSLLSLLMDNGYVPVLASLGADENGAILNINADTVASVLARDLGAAKLISLTAVPGVLRDKDDPATLVPLLTTAEARELLGTGAIGGGMRPKIQAIVDAVEAGVRRGHILSGLARGSILLELFTREGCGTLIVGENEAAEAAADAAAAAAVEAVNVRGAPRLPLPVRGERPLLPDDAPRGTPDRAADRATDRGADRADRATDRATDRTADRADRATDRAADRTDRGGDRSPERVP